MSGDLTDLIKHLGRASSGEALGPVANDVIMAAGNAIADQAKQNAPVRSGRLRDSIEVRPLSQDTVQVIATAPYSGDVERGTRPHVILPRRGRVLAFQVNGRMVFARAVHHPGTAAEPFIAPAVQTGLGEASRKLGQAGVSLIVDGTAGL